MSAPRQFGWKEREELDRYLEHGLRRHEAHLLALEQAEGNEEWQALAHWEEE